MTTLSEQLNLENQQRIQKFNDSHYEWLMKFESQFTHALTLTFNSALIKNFINKASPFKSIAKADLLNLQKKSFRCFANRLNKSLFGNATARHGNRLLLVPILEGVSGDQKVHYHCALGVPENRFEAIEMKVREAWKHAPLSGHHVDIQPYRNCGWLGYINKQAKYVNRECIDWDNVRIPCMS
jgi:hypothetical protein